MSRTACLLTTLAVAVLPAATVPLLAATPAPPADAAAALTSGNRLFRAGDLEEALRVYAAGFRLERGGHLEGLLAYNLGTTAHQLGRLPEAVLWYRRAALALGDGDPWLRDNLTLARQAVGAQEPAAEPGLWVRQRRRLRVAGALLAWAALPMLLLPARLRLWLALPVALLAAAAFAAGTALIDRGPRPAVLLAACPAAPPPPPATALVTAPATVPRAPARETAAEPLLLPLPPGSEVWVTPAGAGGWHLLGEPASQRCPPAAIGLVEG
ncbi:MAG TPA: tetratricopeptide repeat protein [Thermoanaerobaculia bacterium]|nr:tetratricopeptide repeat protein [Thermoanaerobaculia bacterium]